MKRRAFMTAAAAAALPLARPAIGANAKTLIFVPQANLTSLDPVWTTATVTRNFSLMVYETLYGRDQAFNPQPQMVEGHTIDDDGKRWTMKLRDGSGIPRRHAGAGARLRCLAAALAEARRGQRDVQRTGRCDRGSG